MMDMDKAVKDFVAALIVNLILVIGGAYLVSQAFGWQAGVGLAMLFAYLKGGK